MVKKPENRKYQSVYFYMYFVMKNHMYFISIKESGENKMKNSKAEKQQ